jgi:heptosyltransferase-2
MADPSRIVVLSPNWLGDAVMALPAVADLRRRFPSAHLAVAARGSVAPMFELAPGVDTVVTLRWKGRVFDRAGLRADASALRAAAFDAAVLLPNSMASAWVVRSAGVPERWGYAADYRSPLLTRAVPKPRRSRHQAAYYQHLTHALGAPAGPLEPVLTASADDVATARTLLTARGWNGLRALVALAPGAAYGHAKRWPPERYAALVSTLVTAHGATCVLVGAPVDAAATREVQALADAARARTSSTSPVRRRCVHWRCAHAGGHLRVERLWGDAPGGGARRAGRGAVRTDAGQGDRAAGTRFAAGHPPHPRRVLPSLYASGVSLSITGA